VPKAKIEGSIEKPKMDLGLTKTKRKKTSHRPHQMKRKRRKANFYLALLVI
jgi:hypothetical protein